MNVKTALFGVVAAAAMVEADQVAVAVAAVDQPTEQHRRRPVHAPAQAQERARGLVLP